MKHASYLASLSLLTLLVGCGDVSSNHKMGVNKNPTRSTQGAEGTNGDINVVSQIHREKGATVLTYSDEIRKILANDLSAKNYRIIPLMEKDDEGSPLNVTTVSESGRPTVNCGDSASLTGIDSRITDCFQKNGEKATWDGTRFGAAGEGTWKLVALNADSEIWFDGRTGMVWSELRKTATASTFNWCKASGNEEDDSNIGGVDCNTLADKESICVGFFTPNIDKKIHWRLPTRNDLLQADLDGMRSVLRKEGATVGLWTATMVAEFKTRNQAWVYNSANGTLAADQLSAKHAVRCIGAPER